VFIRFIGFVKAIKRHANDLADIAISRGIQWVMINGGGLPISFVDQVNSQPSN